MYLPFPTVPSEKSLLAQTTSAKLWSLCNIILRCAVRFDLVRMRILLAGGKSTCYAYSRTATARYVSKYERSIKLRVSATVVWFRLEVIASFPVLTTRERPAGTCFGNCPYTSGIQPMQYPFPAHNLMYTYRQGIHFNQSISPDDCIR